MAAVKGINTTKYDANGVGDNAIDQGLINAELEVWTETYVAAALANPSTIDIAELPAGAKVHSIDVIHEALGASTTLDIGDSDDPDRYTSAPVSTSSAGSFSSDTVAGTGYVIGTNDGDSRIIASLAGGAATGTIKSIVKFTR